MLSIILITGNQMHMKMANGLSGSLLEKHCRMGAPERAFLREAVQRLALSARAYTRILRISRTIADLAGSESIGVPHLAEAIGCRVLDREEF